MPIEYKKRVAYLIDTVGVEDAETLLTWLQETPASSVNLKQCVHIHSAVLQTLMHEKPKVTREPENQKLKDWLCAAHILS